MNPCYIKTCKYLPGSSSNEVKRINKVAQNYRYDRNIIKYKRPGDNSWRTIPAPNLRTDLIMKAHLIGHFLAQSTYDRQKPDFYWKGMKFQVVNVIKLCEVCARNHFNPVLNHPAIAQKIGGILNDKVAVDLVFGLPETEEGYIGLIVFTDFFTKFPWARPIKSKTAIEMARPVLD